MKSVLITGATAGFGLALAHKYAKEGYHVIATGRRKERLKALQSSYENGTIDILCFDIQDTDAIEQAISSLTCPIDILINNAGLATGGLQNLEDVSWSDITTMINTNITGLVFLTRKILPLMKQKDSGHIINIGSVSGTYPYKGAAVYGGTKAFVKMFSLNLRAELLGSNIRVSNIEPGVADTEFSLVRFADEARAKQVCENFKALTAEDIAEIVYFTSTLPPHVTLNSVEIMSTHQAFAGFAIHRGS